MVILACKIVPPLMHPWSMQLFRVLLTHSTGSGKRGELMYDINYRAIDDGQTALMKATKRGLFDIVKLLVERNCHTGASDRDEGRSFAHTRARAKMHTWSLVSSAQLFDVRALPPSFMLQVKSMSPCETIVDGRQRCWLHKRAI